MFERFKELLGFGTIGGIDDLVVRAAKVAVSTFFGLVGADVLGWVGDAYSVRSALIVAAAAAANVIINTIVKWASS